MNTNKTPDVRHVRVSWDACEREDWNQSVEIHFDSAEAAMFFMATVKIDFTNCEENLQ